jgi:5-methylcytosine-specific restriction endonuclease McrA
MIKKCEKCGIEFTPNKFHETQQRYCSSECYKSTNPGFVYERNQRLLLTDRIVRRHLYITSKGKLKYNQITQDMIVEKRAGLLERRKRIATTKAVNAAKPKIKTCRVCGNESIPNNSNKKYCSIECRKKAESDDAYKRNSAKKELKQRQCKECNTTFIPKYGDKNRVYCSSKCLHKYEHRKRRHITRARLRLVGYEVVDPIKVMARDGWRCQMCGIKLKRKDRGTTKDKAPELDHIIPLSKGGEHSYLNTQCACRKCNREKGAGERGQLRLFG